MVANRTRVFQAPHVTMDPRTGERHEIGAEFSWIDTVGARHALRVVQNSDPDGDQVALYYRGGDVARGALIPRDALELALRQMQLADTRETAETSFHDVPQTAIDEAVAAGVFAGDPRVASQSRPAANPEGTFGWLLARRRSELVNAAINSGALAPPGLSAREEYLVKHALDVVLGELADAWARRSDK